MSLARFHMLENMKIVTTRPGLPYLIYVNIAKKILFNIVEASFKKKLNFDVCVV